MREKLGKNKATGDAGRLINFRPLFFVALFLALGIVFSYLRLTNELAPVAVALPMLLAFIFFIVLFGRRKGCKIALVMLVVYCLGYFLFSVTITDFQSKSFESRSYLVTGRVVERAFSKEQAEVHLDRVTLDGTPAKGRLVAYLPSAFAGELALSDTLSFTAVVTENGDPFGKYGFRAEAIIEERRYYANGVTEVKTTGRSFDLFLWIRNGITETVRSGMDETSAAITLAVLLGDTTGVEEELLKNIRRGGIAHIFAVSGLHIGTLYGVLASFLKRKGKALSRRLRLLLVALPLLLYGGICGFSASVVRAVVTYLTLYVVRLYGGKKDTVEAISLAAVCVLLLNPVHLFSAGFQLSFLACYGIAFLSRPIADGLTGGLLLCEELVRRVLKRPPQAKPDPFSKKFFKRSNFSKTARKVSGFLGVTLSAQLFTFPALLQSFGEISELGLFLNCLFVPLLSLVFCPLLAIVTVATVFSVGQGVLLYLPSVLISSVMLPFETLVLRSVDFWGLSWSISAMASYYLGLLCASDKVNLRVKGRIACISISFLSAIAALFA